MSAWGLSFVQISRATSHAEGFRHMGSRDRWFNFQSRFGVIMSQSLQLWPYLQSRDHKSTSTLRVGEDQMGRDMCHPLYALWLPGLCYHWSTVIRKSKMDNVRNERFTDPISVPTLQQLLVTHHIQPEPEATQVLATGVQISPSSALTNDLRALCVVPIPPGAEAIRVGPKRTVLV